MNRPDAVVLLSGGLDSATTLAIAQDQGFAAFAISFRYGQRHAAEISSAEAIAERMKVREHLVLDIDLSRFGGSALTADLPVPKHDSVQEIGQGIPATYVPARNTVFLALALSWAEVLQVGDLFIGVNALDYSGYPDCRPAFIEAFQAMANLATKGAVEGHLPVAIHAPLIALSKSQIIAQGLALGVDYGLTTSCYDPPSTELACGRCDACLLRLRGFAENGIDDPIQYSEQMG